MRFEWDAAKNETNIARRGLAFDRVAEVFAGEMRRTRDERHDYGEPRWIGYGKLRGRVVVVVWTERGPDTVRVISLRKANARERKSSKPAKKGKKAASRPRIVRMTAEQARHAPDRTDWARVDAMTDEDIARQIAEDPDVAPEITDEMIARAEVIEVKRTPITIKIEPDVLAFYKRGGPGYQTRMNAVLRAYAETRMADGRLRGARVK